MYLVKGFDLMSMYCITLYGIFKIFEIINHGENIIQYGFKAQRIFYIQDKKQ